MTLLVAQVCCGRHKKNNKNGKQKNKKNNGGGNNGGGGVRCGVQYYTVQDTEYQTSCSNSYKTECSTSYSSVCSNTPQTTYSNQCSQQSIQEPVSICTNEVLEVDCIVGGKQGKCYQDYGGKSCRQGVSATKKVETCVPVHTHSQRRECKQSPQQVCKQVPSKTCNQRPVTRNRQVARRVCG